MNRKNCTPLRLFDAKIEKTIQEDFIPIKRTIHREIRGCQDIILWTDGDREGEDIAQEIVDVCHEGMYMYTNLEKIVVLFYTCHFCLLFLSFVYLSPCFPLLSPSYFPLLSLSLYFYIFS